MICLEYNSAVILVGEFTDDDKVPAAPVSVTVSVKAPDGVVTTVTGGPSITNPQLGRYEYLLVLDQTGFWRWRWEGTMTDNSVAVDEGTVQVGRDNFT